MLNVGLTDRVRALVSERYVQPALKAGQTHLSIGVKDILNEFSQKGDFPRFRTPVICQALLGDKIQTQNGLVIESVDGPPSKQSRRVVVHYRVVAPVVPGSEIPPSLPVETPSDKAFRLTQKLRGLLKTELAEYGGAEGFMHWIRSEEETDPV